MNRRFPNTVAVPLCALIAGAACLCARLGAAAPSPAGPDPAAAPALPSPFPVTGAVSYGKEIKALFAHHCYECHGKGKAKGGLSLMSREDLLKGGKHGPAINPGRAQASAMLKRITSADPEEIMPPEGPRLAPEQVALLSRWIDQGAAWDEVPSTALIRKPQNILPRKVAPPPGDGTPVDRLVAAYLARNKVVPPVVIDDRTFARRLYLDLVGLPPTPEELERFLDDPAPDKRARLARQLLADDQRYADHWITFWQDHLRDGKIDLGGTDVFRAITPWLLKALKENRPYDRFVRELVDPPIPRDFAIVDSTIPGQDDAKNLEKEFKPDENDSFGFVQGLRAGLEKPRGDQRWEVQAVQNISQVFLGANLKCATCHDSFIDYWTMKDVWGLASVYADKPLEAVRCEMPQGIYPAPAFIFPEVGTVDPNASTAERRKQLAILVTSPDNGRFARTVVNRLWARLLGRGIVDPVDDMDSAPFDADLLDYLASDLVANGYDLKKTIEAIVTSKAYQLPAIDPGKPAPGGVPADAAYMFRGPLLRRMTAEQFSDALAALQRKPGRAWKQNGGRLLEVLGRPDRRTVTTGRDHKSSPMQALELLNGPALYEWVYLDPPPPAPRSTDTAAARKAEARQLPPNPRLKELSKLDAKTLVTRVYTHALSRPPTDEEQAAYAELLGEKPTPESVADFLWVVVNLPEFQLIR